MGKTLIIAEKPSVANDIAKALGGFKKQDDYFESEHFVLSSAVGHLLELAAQPQRKAREVASAFPGVADVQVFGDRLHLRVAEGTAQVVEQLPQTLASAGVTMAHLRPAEPTLEDVFTELLSRGS